MEYFEHYIEEYLNVMDYFEYYVFDYFEYYMYIVEYLEYYIEEYFENYNNMEYFCRLERQLEEQAHHVAGLESDLANAVDDLKKERDTSRDLTREVSEQVSL